jgi:hypothetical protein
MARHGSRLLALRDLEISNNFVTLRKNSSSFTKLALASQRVSIE